MDWKIVEPKVFSHISNLLFLRKAKNTKQKLPRFLTFMLQNLNKLTLPQLERLVIPTMPFTLHPRITAFLIDSFAMIATKYGTEIDLNMNSVMNAPNIDLALS